DSGATHSFVSLYFALKLLKDRELMKIPLSIITHLGDSMDVKHIYTSYVVELGGRKLLANLIELPVLDFNVILGMDWLEVNHATIDCYRKCIEFKPKGEIEFVFQEDRSEAPTNLISVVIVKKLLAKGCQGYLTHIVDTEAVSEEL